MEFDRIRARLRFTISVPVFGRLAWGIGAGCSSKPQHLASFWWTAQIRRSLYDRHEPCELIRFCRCSLRWATSHCRPPLSVVRGRPNTCSSSVEIRRLLGCHWLVVVVSFVMEERLLQDLQCSMRVYLVEKPSITAERSDRCSAHGLPYLVKGRHGHHQSPRIAHFKVDSVLFRSKTQSSGRSTFVSPAYCRG